jgi:hypothetical protein
MSTSNAIVIGALGGVAVTVVAYQLLVIPRARASAAPACAPAIAAGAGSPAALHAAPSPGPDLVAQIRQKELELAALRQSVVTSGAVATEAEKRAEAVEGKPREWPANLPAAYRSEALESKLNAMLQKTGLGNLADINCDEYPCVAVIQAKNGDANWQKNLQAALKEMAATGEFGPGTSISMWGSHSDNENGPPTILSAVALTPQADYDDELHKRTGNRAGAALSNLSH